MTLCPVTEENRAAAERLAVAPGQEDFIESVPECLREADALSDWRPMLICADGAPVGFTMYGDIRCETPARLWFDRLLIDGHCQHRGLGRRAVETILRRLRQDYPGKDIYLSAYEDNERAIALYRSFGFAFNGELDTKGEKIMVLRA